MFCHSHDDEGGDEEGTNHHYMVWGDTPPDEDYIENAEPLIDLTIYLESADCGQYEITLFNKHS